MLTNTHITLLNQFPQASPTVGRSPFLHWHRSPTPPKLHYNREIHFNLPSFYNNRSPPYLSPTDATLRVLACVLVRTYLTEIPLGREYVVKDRPHDLFSNFRQADSLL